MAAPTPVARKINREGVVLFGWGRAILLQIAHPLVGAAVGDFSAFDHSAKDYLRRVNRTVGGMLTLTFGSEAEAAEVIARINGIHDRVHGTLAEAAGPFPAGTPYSARDPELLLWVHVTILDSIMLAYERLVQPLRPEERDAFCAEAADTPERLGVPPAMVPRTYADLQAYLNRTLESGAIVVTPRARQIAAALFSPPFGPPAMPLAAASRLVTVGLLPDSVRQGYHFTWDAGRERRCRAVMGFIRRARWALPPMLREWRMARAA
jgi:uncharacterized protein (DUF2236 family)